jgi:hypothetical protein
MLRRTMKMKILITTIVVALVALFLFLFPRFYFNHLEYQGRGVFSSIEEARQIANAHIEQRSGREGGQKTSLEVTNLSIDITADLNKVNFLIDEHESILDKQLKFKFLLPKKYKEYLALKKDVFDKYYSSLRKFKSLKEYEGGITDILVKSDQFSQAMNTKGVTFDELYTKVKDLGDTRDNLKKFFDNGFMTSDYYNAVLADINAKIDLYNLLSDATKNNYSASEVDKKMGEIAAKYKHADIMALYYDSYDKNVVPKQNEWSNLYNQANDLTFGALDYYDNNKLAYDPLSVIFSKFDKSYPKNTSLKNNLIDHEDKKVDLNGDGKEETLRLSYAQSETSQFPDVSLVAYDEKGNEIGRLPDSMPIEQPLSGSAKAYVGMKKDGKQLISYEFIAGPHSSHTMFFGLFGLKTGGEGILPVCPTLDVKSAYDCLFWSGEVGSLVVADFDNDGYLEVAEMVDEYPKDGSINTDVEKAIDETFKDSGQNAINEMTRIAKREQGGRGNRVVWGIYRYDGKYFAPQLGVNYEKYYPLVTAYLKRFYKDYPTIMKKGDMSKDSLDYNEFMRSFWTKGQK